MCLFVCMCLSFAFWDLFKFGLSVASFGGTSFVFVPPGPPLKAILCCDDGNVCDVALFGVVFSWLAFALFFLFQVLPLLRKVCFLIR